MALSPVYLIHPNSLTGHSLDSTKYTMALPCPLPPKIYFLFAR